MRTWVSHGGLFRPGHNALQALAQLMRQAQHSRPIVEGHLRPKTIGGAEQLLCTHNHKLAVLDKHVGRLVLSEALQKVLDRHYNELNMRLHLGSEDESVWRVF